jgi:hypothetical protein
VILPESRSCHEKFREDGIMLPFGHLRESFTVPNPTLFQSGGWPMESDMGPLDGWCRDDVASTSAGPASNDLYGLLYHYLRNIFSGFRQRVSENPFQFQLPNIEAKELRNNVDGLQFDRIEVSTVPAARHHYKLPDIYADLQHC